MNAHNSVFETDQLSSLVAWCFPQMIHPQTSVGSRHRLLRPRSENLGKHNIATSPDVGINQNTRVRE